MFKKDLAKLAYVCSNGKGKLLDIKLENKTGEDSETMQMFLGGFMAISTEIFEDNLTFQILETLSSEYKKEEKLKATTSSLTISDDFYSNLINESLLSTKRYSRDDFDRYQYDNICPENEVIGLSISFMDKISKLFEDPIDYIFFDKYIIGVKEFTIEPLFIIGGVGMPKQLNLLTGLKE